MKPRWDSVCLCVNNLNQEEMDVKIHRLRAVLTFLDRISSVDNTLMRKSTI